MTNGNNGNGNGNGEVKKLVNLKHAFKDEATQLETDLRTKFEQELEAAEKDLKDKYLDQVVDWFYGNGFNGKPPQPVAAESEPEQAPSDSAPKPGDTPDTAHCTNCGANLLEGDQFCSQCAAPVEANPDQAPPQEPVEEPVATAGRLRRPGYIGYAYSVPGQRMTADERVRSWGRTQRR